jgi:hypothetical protein
MKVGIVISNANILHWVQMFASTLYRPKHMLQIQQGQTRMTRLVADVVLRMMPEGGHVLVSLLGLM